MHLSPSFRVKFTVPTGKHTRRASEHYRTLQIIARQEHKPARNIPRHPRLQHPPLLASFCAPPLPGSRASCLLLATSCRTIRPRLIHIILERHSTTIAGPTRRDRYFERPTHTRTRHRDTASSPNGPLLSLFSRYHLLLISRSIPTILLPSKNVIMYKIK